MAPFRAEFVEVFCRCDRDVAAARYAAWAGTRAAGHFDGQRRPDELWNDEVAEPVARPWPVIEVHTYRSVDVGALLVGVRRW